MKIRRIVLRAATGTAGIVVVILIIMWMAGLFRHRVAPGVVEVGPVAAPAGPTAEVVEVPQQEVKEVVGTLQPEHETMISSRIMAKIEQMTVDAGDEVAQGQVVVILDDRDLQARLGQAREQVAAADATLKQAERDYKRNRELFEKGVVGAREFDQVEQRWRVAQAALEQARQALAEAEVTLTYAQIRAPVAGRVVDRFADPGDTAIPGKPLLAIYDPKRLRLETPVPESCARCLAVGQQMMVHVDALDLDLQGKVDEIVPQAEAASRTFLVKVAVPAHEGLYPGMFGRLRIPAGQRARICVPSGAVERVGQLEFVYVVHDDGKVERRFVKTGEPCNGDNLVEVLSGLKAGEKILLSGERGA